MMNRPTTHDQKVAMLRGASAHDVTRMWRTLVTDGTALARAQFSLAARDAGFEREAAREIWRRKP